MYPTNTRRSQSVYGQLGFFSGLCVMENSIETDTLPGKFDNPGVRFSNIRPQTVRHDFFENFFT